MLSFIVDTTSFSSTPDTKMALVGKKSYPKATLKKIIKAHSNLNIKKNADVTVRTRRVATRNNTR